MTRKLAATLAAMIPLLILGASARSRPSVAVGSELEGPNGLDSTMWTAIQNVDLRIGTKPDEDAALRIRNLRGRVFRTDPDKPPFLDDPDSFGIEVTSGTVALDGEGLTTLLNERVFNYHGAPIRGLKVTIENGQLVQRGIMRKGVDLRFTMWSTVALTEDKRIRAHPTRLTFLGVNGLSLLHALGLKMEKVLDLKGANGIVQMQGDDMLLEPLRMIPPPRVKGRLANVRIEGNEIVQEFEATPADTIFRTYMLVDRSIRNYIYYKGATLKFGLLTMTPTNLLIGDADETDRFDLDLARYDEQLVAGYTKILPNKGLHTWMPDRADLKRGVEPPLVPGDVRGGTTLRRP